jgi:hypothetical protein
MKAFPTYAEKAVNREQGMDLRDYFAAKVMHYWLVHPMSTIHIENLCKGAYQVADAMMKARNE